MPTCGYAQLEVKLRVHHPIFCVLLQGQPITHLKKPQSACHTWSNNASSIHLMCSHRTAAVNSQTHQCGQVIMALQIQIQELPLMVSMWWLCAEEGTTHSTLYSHCGSKVSSQQLTSLVACQHGPNMPTNHSQTTDGGSCACCRSPCIANA